MGSHIDELRARERAELVATLRLVGPDAPTLCAGWSAADIAAHLVVSERAFGIPLFIFNGVRRVVPARLTRRAIEASRGPGDRLNVWMITRGWDVLLGRLETGPPRLYGFGTLADLRTVEEWIHHEDVRRGSNLPSRTPDPAYEAALWRAGMSVARFPEFRLGREGIELDAGDGRRFVIGDAPHARIRVAGPPGELLLFFSGRGDAADVSIEGDDALMPSLQTSLRV